jgi:hypothetical protein
MAISVPQFTTFFVKISCYNYSSITLPFTTSYKNIIFLWYKRHYIAWEMRLLVAQMRLLIPA